MDEILTLVPSTYVVASTNCGRRDNNVQVMSIIQHTKTAAKPIFMNIESEGMRSVPLLSLIMPIMIMTIATVIRKWYWMTRNHSNLLFNLGLRARRLQESQIAMNMAQKESRMELTLRAISQGRPGAEVKVRCWQGS
jgi:hypothetical protein